MYRDSTSVRLAVRSLFQHRIGLIPGFFAAALIPAQLGGGTVRGLLGGVDALDAVALFQAAAGVIPLRAVEDDVDARRRWAGGPGGLVAFLLVQVVERLGEERLHVGAEAGGVAAFALVVTD